MEGQIWHGDCLRCKECNKKITGANWGGFVPPDNTAYCRVYVATCPPPSSPRVLMGWRCRHYDRMVAAKGNSVSFSSSVVKHPSGISKT